MNSISSINHEAISQRAYQIWEESGRPDGNHTDHWLQAERELNAAPAKTHTGNGTRDKVVEPPPAKHLAEKAPHSTNYVHPGVTTDSLRHHRH